MTASTGQGARVFVSTSDDIDGTVADYAKIADPVNITLAVPIKGDIDATTLESTAISMIDDLVEEITLNVSCHQDLTDTQQKKLLAIQASKTKSAFRIEVPEQGVSTVTAFDVIGWVRNFQGSLSPRAVQGASFDLLTRQAITITHGTAKQS